MASAKAIERMDWTRIFVAAPGLRPTAVEAAVPIKPTPTAAPAAARPTWIFPPTIVPVTSATANNGTIDIYPSFLYFLVGFEDEHSPAGEVHLSSFMLCWGLFLMLANQQGEDSSQQHEEDRKSVV